MLNGRELRRYFIQFNAQYFGNKLPPYAIRVVPCINSMFRGQTNRRARLIRIVQGQPDVDAISILIHEMAHARTTEHHTMPWKREMVRLKAAGAPLTVPDSEITLDDWDGVGVTKQMFRRRLDNIFCSPSSLKLTLSDAIRDFIWSYGGARGQKQTPPFYGRGFSLHRFRIKDW